MGRTQKLVIALGALVLAAVVVYVDMRLEKRKQTQGAPEVVAAVEARLLAAKKSKKAAAVTEACTKGICACAPVAARNGLDVDAYAEVLAVLAIAAQSCPADDMTAALHAEGVARMTDNDRAKAEAAQVLAKDPNNPYGLYSMALVNYRAGELPEALAIARRAAAAGRGPTAHLLTGLVAYAMGNLESAAAEFRAITMEDPDDLDALFNLALIAQRQDRYTEAREGYLRVANLDPNNKNARYNLAILAHSIGANDEAQYHFTKFQSIAAGDDRIEKLKSLLETREPTRPAAPAISGAIGVAPPISSATAR
jgi:tetratricopeptide (TPR) repeat protein